MGFQVKHMTNDLWERIDLDSTVKDYEFTRRAFSDIHRVVYSSDFEDMDADMIFSYLQGKMQLISFRDYLRRYLYSAAQITEPFYSVSDDVYSEIIRTSFEETYTPHSVEPTTKRWSAVIKSWLTAENVRRSTVFLLGFGLRMSASDVSEFLTKVIKEEDINPAIPEEVIYCYCYGNHLPWSFAQKKVEWYQQINRMEGVLPLDTESDKNEGQLKGRVPAFSDEKELDRYLISLKKSYQDQAGVDIASQIFGNLVKRAKEKVVDIYQEDGELGESRRWKAEDITSADLEKIICCGIPMTTSGNLQKMSASLLNKHFHQKRISRQRIEKLLQHKLSVDRYDLITLLFFIYTQEMADEEPEIRCKNYMDEANELLNRCHMSGLYPVNPYEAFILMCLLCDSPLPTYSDIWEMSYQQG